jgi:hypothetical protein
MLSSRKISLVLAILALFVSGQAFAQKKGKKADKKAPAEKAPPKVDAKAVSELMGTFKWGMSKDEVIEAIEKLLTESNAEKIKATSDIYERDRLKKKVKAEVAAIKKSEVKFEGKKLGWDVSIIEREFGHKNDETMIVWQEYDESSGKDQQRFFFFVDAKLWKMFIAFNMDAFKDKTFADFQVVMENRYGKAAVHTVPNADGVDEVDFIFWRSDGYYLRAIDLTRFYGNFCLALSDDGVEKTIYSRRAERNPPTMKTRIVDSVEEGGEPINLQDENADIIDRMTKKGGK